MSKNKFTNLKWIFEVSRRFSTVDRKGRSAATSKLAIAGICFGVMTLIVVMSIMNGFQLSSIEPILEISSYHIRAENIPAEKNEDFINLCKQNKDIAYVTSFYEAQTMMTGTRGRESVAVIRAVDPAIFEEDKGLMKEYRLTRGFGDLEEPNSIILGSSLARTIGAGIGSEVNLLVMSGGNDVELFSQDRIFTVTGIFSCGYPDINSSYCFINKAEAPEYFGKESPLIWGIKLNNSSKDVMPLNILQKAFPEAQISSWREYNKSFFGALRIEKNILLLLVALIFVVVAINIYNGMRRLVFERRSEIAILSALGAKNPQIKAIFIMKGFLTGFIGAAIGVALGLLISLNSEVVFMAASKILYFFQYIFTAIFNHENLAYIQENSSYLYYSQIPARIFPREVVMIAAFGIFAPLIASWAASKNVLKMTVAEVLHDE